MSRHDDGVRLRHMLDAARQAIAFAQGRSRADLDQDLQLALALTRLAASPIRRQRSAVPSLGLCRQWLLPT
jgi:hypothetical protein